MTQTKSTDFEKNWNNYWSGRGGQKSGSALVGIEKHPEIAGYWAEIFSNLPKSTNILDLACGAGSVLKVAYNSGFRQVSGLDISESAIELLANTFPEVKGYVGSVTDTPFAEGTFDIIASQFGFEYAGSQTERIKAAQEISRILKNRGRAVLMCHVDGGAIMQGCKLSLEQIKGLLDSNFFLHAKKTFSAAHLAAKTNKPSDGKKAQKSLSDLGYAAEPILDHLRGAPDRKNDFTRFLFYLLEATHKICLLYTSPSPRDRTRSRMPSSA